MLDHHQFFQSRYHKSSKKHSYAKESRVRSPHYGSLPSHKSRAKTSMNHPFKQQLIDKGMEKIFLLADRIFGVNLPEQFIKPRSHIPKSQQRYYE